MAIIVNTFAEEASILSRILPGETVRTVEKVNGGYSCKKYLVRTMSNQYVLRIENPSNEDNFPETSVIQLAADLGVGPQVKAHSKEQGWLLLEYIPIQRWPTFKTNPLPFCKAMSLLNVFHKNSVESLGKPKAKSYGLCCQSYAPFSYLFIQGNEMLRNIPSLPKHFSEAMANIQLVFESLLSWLEEHATYCHGDFHKDNVLYDGKRVFLIDWETVEWGDPFFDVVKFSVTLEEEDRIKLLAEYLGYEPTKKEIAHFKLMEITFLMVIVVKRFELAYGQNLNSSEYLSKSEMEELLDSSEPFPSFLSVSYRDTSPKGRQKGALYALKEYMLKIKDEAAFSNLLKELN